MSDDFHGVPDEPADSVSRGWMLQLSRLIGAWTVTFRQGLPLFRREMLVQSYRPRTYVVRVIFAITLFMVALAYTSITTGSSLFASAVRLPGEGRVILDALVAMLFVFIYVFAPATSSGVITLEKERQTLVLLYLTKLTAWHVILEKFLSRLLPTFSILLLAMPLLVFAYAFGGVNLQMLVTSMWFLSITVLQVTAVAVLGSTLCRQTTHAFLTTLALLLLLYFGPALADVWLLDGKYTNTFFTKGIQPTTYVASPTTQVLGLNSSPTPPAAPLAIPQEVTLLACFPPLLFAIHYQPFMVGGSFAMKNMLLAGYPTLLSAVISLILARCCVFYRAFEDQRTPFRKQLQQVFGRFRMSYVSERRRAATAAAALVNVPDNNPIAWRETFRSSGNWLPFLLLLEIPTLVLIFWLARNSDGTPDSISLVIFVLWIVGVLLICVHSASLMTKERSQQTLDLLLTTPLTSADIIQQKFNGTRRLMLIFAAPLMTVIVFQSWWRTILQVPINNVPVVNGVEEVGFVWWEYLITAGSCVFIYLQLVGWIALWAGLRNKSPTRATLDALGGVVFCCVVPQVLLLVPLAMIIPPSLVQGNNMVALISAQLTPVLMIALAEYTNLRDLCDIALLPTITNSVIYGIMLYQARRYVLNRADIFLGRTVHY